MTDYNTMTAQQCADWLAERDGWTKEIDTDGQVSWVQHREKWLNDERAINMTRQYVHPMPMTLDAAAAALLEPWRLVSLQVNSVGWAFVKAYNPSVGWMELDAPDRLTAEYRAAVAARMEDDK